MALYIPDDINPNERADNRKNLLITCAGVIGFFFLFDDVIGWFNGGGLFSIVAAFKAIAAGARTIDIDSATLRIFFVAACCVLVIPFAIWLNVDIRKRLSSFLVLFSIIGGAFFLDIAYDEDMVKGYMAKHGYSRCSSHDHHIGNGKSRIWFANYVRGQQDCPAETEADLNRGLPRQTAIFTRLDYITKTDLYITYAYTITDASGSPLEQNLANAVIQKSSYLNEKLKEDVCRSRRSNYLSKGLIENFRYAGSAGVIKMISIEPHDCGSGS